jgi:hypothetical protein
MKEVSPGDKPTATDMSVVEFILAHCERLRHEDEKLPILITGGDAQMYYAELGERLHLTEKELKISTEPDMDIAVGGIYYASLPEVRSVLLKTPIVQKPDSWWSKKQKLNWDTMQAALRRYGLPSLGDSQQKMWDVLENL